MKIFKVKDDGNRVLRIESSIECRRAAWMLCDES